MPRAIPRLRANLLVSLGLLAILFLSSVTAFDDSRYDNVSDTTFTDHNRMPDVPLIGCGVSIGVACAATPF